MATEKKKCSETVYVRDCMRRTGRGPSGFEMHYSRQQCSRNAVEDGLCRQHWKIKTSWKCQFCGFELEARWWKNNKCRSCGKEYNATLAQDSEE